MFNRILESIRTAPPLDARKIRFYALALGGMPWMLYCIETAIQLLTISFDGKQPPMGSDFLSFYAASLIALNGNPADVYVMKLHAAAHKVVFPNETDYFAFFYPPLFLLIVLPLAKMSYWTSMVVWTTTTLVASVAVLRRIGPPQLGLLPILAFPAVFMTVLHGQNAFLTTALFGAALLCMERRPILAGVCFGLLAFKPQFGVLVPIFLLVSWRWDTIVAAGITVVAFGLATIAVLGFDVWPGWVAISEVAKKALNYNHIGDYKMQSIFAMLRLLGASLDLAYAIQGIAAAIVIATLVVVTRKRPGSMAAGVVMVTGALLTTPFMLRYDLMLLAIPLCWLVREVSRTGLRKWELEVGILAFALPLVPIELAQHGHFMVAPFVIASLFYVVTRRALSPEVVPAASADSIGSSGPGWSGPGFPAAAHRQDS